MTTWQKAAVALFGTLIALPGAFFWLLGYAMSTCGPNAALYALIGLGVLVVAVIALWVTAFLARTSTVPLWLLGAVSVVSVYMAFGRSPGC